MRSTMIKKYKSILLFNEQGQTLVTTMVSLAITSIIALLAVDINSNLAKSQRNSTLYNDMSDLSKEISFALQDPASCVSAFNSSAIDITKIMPSNASSDESYLQSIDIAIPAGNGVTFKNNTSFAGLFVKDIRFVLTSGDKNPDPNIGQYLGYFRISGMTGTSSPCEAATGICNSTTITNKQDLPFRNKKVLATITVDRNRKVTSCTSSGFGDQSEAIQAAYQQSAALLKSVMTSDSNGNLLGSTKSWSAAAGGSGIPAGALYKKIDYTSSTPPENQTTKRDCEPSTPGPQDQYLVLTTTDPSQADQECAEGKKCSITTPAAPPTTPKDIYTCSCKRKVICNFDSYIGAN